MQGLCAWIKDPELAGEASWSDCVLGQTLNPKPQIPKYPQPLHPQPGGGYTALLGEGSAVPYALKTPKSRRP